MPAWPAIMIVRPAAVSGGEAVDGSSLVSRRPHRLDDPPALPLAVLMRPVVTAHTDDHPYIGMGNDPPVALGMAPPSIEREREHAHELLAVVAAVPKAP